MIDPGPGRFGGVAAIAAGAVLAVKVGYEAFAGSAFEARFGSDLGVVLEILAFGLLLVAVIGLRKLLIEQDRRMGTVALSLGAAGATGVVAFDGLVLQSAVIGEVVVWALALAQIAAACWFIAAGTAVRRAEGPLSPIGWLGQVGSIAFFIAPIESIAALVTRKELLAPGAYLTVLPAIVAVAFLYFVGRYAINRTLPPPTGLTR